MNTNLSPALGILRAGHCDRLNMSHVGRKGSLPSPSVPPDRHGVVRLHRHGLVRLDRLLLVGLKHIALSFLISAAFKPRAFASRGYRERK